MLKMVIMFHILQYLNIFKRVKLEIGPFYFDTLQNYSKVQIDI